MRVNKHLVILGAIAFITLPSLAGKIQPKGKVYKSTPPEIRFVPLNIYIDPAGKSLGAYQFELKILSGNVKIAGIEGSDHHAFKKAPYYDPEALNKQRIIIAAYTTDTSCPTNKIRIATLHLCITGDKKPEYALDLQVAADNQGQAVNAAITLEEGEIL